MKNHQGAGPRQVIHSLNSMKYIRKYVIPYLHVSEFNSKVVSLAYNYTANSSYTGLIASNHLTFSLNVLQLVLI